MDQPANQLPSDQHSAPDRDEKLGQLERILASRTFFNALRLQKFLRFVALKAIEGREDEVKEYTVGVHVFRKGDDFDPRTDTQVRTEASRLRMRLERYYASEGASDDLILELPKGHYVPQFSRRLPKTADFDGNAGQLSAKEEEPAGGPRLEPSVWRWGIWRAGIIIAVVAVAAFWAGTSLSVRKPAPAGLSPAGNADGSPVTELWTGLIEAGNPPLVAYSNPAYLTTPQRELLPFTEAGTLPIGTLIPESHLQKRAGGSLITNGVPLSFMDTMTGIGEVTAVVSLDRVLRRLGSTAEIKRGRLVTTDDLHRRNVVFVGSPVVNGVLDNLRLSGEFAFVEGLETGPYWKEYITNLHPKPGEKKTYGVDRDPESGALTVEHALISFLPGISPRRTIVMLAGIDTGGTAAAAEFATSSSGLQELAGRLGYPDAKSGRQLPPFFEALIRVEYARGMVLGIRCEAARVIQPQRSAFLAGASGSNADSELK
jgi:hypothetical protein